ncbi:U-scoloptoxin(19)-Sm1a-like [Portunus trituberculatus]|uniref:U-scoloptoxin(19)-Sm1a-like n=1 Tax=Portunus trituberculatus TaxID=210409 RepID=UPI001E1D20B1|nr:U-scoloptoxin(19)-Sm1a-like [Portunus trituberculatus]
MKVVLPVVVVMVVAMVGVGCFTFTQPEIENEAGCLLEGGECSLVSQCPKPFRLPGLCPDQQARGIDCCRTATSDYDCRKQWGICLPTESCGNLPKDPHAPCPANQVCCLIVD